MDESEGLWVRRYPGEPPPLVALHGFTQTGAMYAELAEMLGRETLAPDLPGHGHSSDRPASFGAAVAGVADVLAARGEPAPLIGYSQGGRVALAVALGRPELLSHLVLVSTTTGVGDEAERAERRRGDEALVEELTTLGLVSFLDRWLARPMFEGRERRDPTWRAADRAARFENTAAGLAAALLGMGQGAQPYLGDRLGELRIPVLVVAGEFDPKYVTLAMGMCRSLPNAVLSIVPATGHAVIGEQPKAVAGLIEGFLNQLKR
jgi:2-succinyl-6-hydroxy-2,4-cyclohexadiene-1-carboxylate synthase